jgi:hypothetical protein
MVETRVRGRWKHVALNGRSGRPRCGWRPAPHNLISKTQLPTRPLSPRRMNSSVRVSVSTRRQKIWLDSDSLAGLQPTNVNKWTRTRRVGAQLSFGQRSDSNSGTCPRSDPRAQRGRAQPGKSHLSAYPPSYKSSRAPPSQHGEMDAVAMFRTLHQRRLRSKCKSTSRLRGIAATGVKQPLTAAVARGRPRGGGRRGGRRIVWWLADVALRLLRRGVREWPLSCPPVDQVGSR